MGVPLYTKLKDLLAQYPKGMQIGMVQLSKDIMMCIGADPRTIENALKTMLTTKLITDIGNCHFTINGKQEENKM